MNKKEKLAMLEKTATKCLRMGLPHRAKEIRALMFKLIREGK